MKKIIVIIATLLSLAAPIHLNADMAAPPIMTFGNFATYSDVAGVGKVIKLNPYNITVQVDHPLFGCTNQQILAITPLMDIWVPEETFEKFDEEYTLRLADDNEYPLPMTRIVFFAYTNSLNAFYNSTILKWDVPFEELKLTVDEWDDFEEFERDGRYTLLDLKQSWLYPDMDNGLVFAYLTNVIQTVRMERNWTNFYAVCRSGVSSPSERVSKDAKLDVFNLMKYASLEQLQFMQNDPLFPAVWADELVKQIARRIKYPNDPLPIWKD